MFKYIYYFQIKITFFLYLLQNIFYNIKCKNTRLTNQKINCRIFLVIYVFLEYKVINNNYKNINQILKQEFKLSARLMHKVIINKLVLLNNKQIDTRSSINIGDNVKIDLNYEEKNDNIVPVKMNLDILYEDDCFLIINKTAGIAVHPSILHFEDSPLIDLI